MVVLCIMDGYGLSENKNKNAVFLAKKPSIDNIFKTYNQVTGNASGLSVGLPDGQMGNSEVGHLNMGAGRIIYQDITRITKEIDEGVFFTNKELLSAIDHAKQNNSCIHLMGLLSDGGVHSLNTHLYALIDLCKKENIKNVYIHCFTDGRDTAPDSAIKYVKELKEVIDKKGIGKISTVAGRYYAMDRDKNYDRIKIAYDILVGNEYNIKSDAEISIQELYDEKTYDEFIKPFQVGTEEEVKNSRIKDNDSIIFFNFRPDRARQLTRTFVSSDFDFFDRIQLNNLCFVCFTEYDESITNKLVAFRKEEIKNTLGEVLAKNNLTQLRTAETEKYAHVTFFFNGGVETANKNEDRILIPSPKEVPTYDLKPEMSAYKVCDTVLNAIDDNKYDVIIVNFANPDMVGHTGVLDAAIKAVETVDECVGKIYDKIKNTDNALFICADHGNCEKMEDEDGRAFTAHTSNKVPFCLVNNKGYKLKDNGALCDIAPTILDIMNIDKPKEMTGNSLIVRNEK